jgi:predicted site-specific integrase-resolvase
MPKIIDTENYVSVEDAAELLDISIATAWRWKKSGRLETTNVFGRILVSRDDIDKARQANSAPKPE